MTSAAHQCPHLCSCKGAKEQYQFLLLDEAATAPRAVIVIISGRMETLLNPDNSKKQEAHHQVGLDKTRAP